MDFCISCMPLCLLYRSRIHRWDIYIVKRLVPLIIKMHRTIINQVRELMDRHWNAFEIANKLGIDINTVKFAMDVIREMVT